MRTFPGYRRADGRVGIRNLLLVLPTSELCNRASELIEAAEPRATCITHFNASANSDRDFHLRVMTGFATNPNVGHVLLLGLGDEHDLGPQLASSIEAKGVGVELHTLYDAGGVKMLAEQVAAKATRILDDMAKEPRVECDVGELTLGTECGGSDAYSGLTANPALGVASDLLIAEGGTSLLAEMPELIGAEHLVAARAVDQDVAKQVVAAVRGWETMVEDFGEDLRGAQPTPGNQDGGLTTIEEKSLGTISKSGTAPVVEVVGYGETPTRRGLVIMDTPGHDVEQLTSMAAGGAQIVVFTTGRGTPTCSPVAPTIKVATNHRTASKIANHIDIDAGGIATGEATKDDIGRAIFEEMIAVASGKVTKAEQYGQKDFALPRTAPSWTS